MAAPLRPPVRTVRAIVVAGEYDDNVRKAAEAFARSLEAAGASVSLVPGIDAVALAELFYPGAREDELRLLYLSGDGLSAEGLLHVSNGVTPTRIVTLNVASLVAGMSGRCRYALIVDAPHSGLVADLAPPDVAVLASCQRDQELEPGPFTWELARCLGLGVPGPVNLGDVYAHLERSGLQGHRVLSAVSADEYVIGWLRQPPSRPTDDQRHRLPRSASVFVGRQAELARITDALTESQDRPPVVAITGPGGIGKTQLAVRVARTLRDHYDEVSYVSAEDGFATALVQFATAAGIVSSRGFFQDAMESLHLLERPTLLIVDDVDAADPNLDPAELRAKLPTRCGMLLVGRVPPPGMDRHTVVALEGLNSAEIIDLLARLGAGNQAGDSRLLSRVQGSPLFARLAAGGAFEEGADSLRVVVERSYRRLEAEAAALFRRASLVPAALVADGMDAELAAVLVDGATDFAALRDAGLFTELVGGRVDFTHPLVRDYAAERYAEDEERGERELAERRVRGWLLGHTHHQPEPRIARDYWTVDDQLDYAPYADAIAAFIRHRDTAPPLTIGIKAQWGEGKTSLMRMVQQRLDPPEASRIRLRRRGSEPEPERRVSTREVLDRAASAPEPVGDLEATPPDTGSDWRATVWFNPWMYQSTEQVWAGMAYEIIRQVTERLSIGDRERFWLELNLARLDTEAVRRRAYRILWSRVLPFLVVAGLVAVLALLALLVGGGAIVARYLAGGGIVGAAGVAVAGWLWQRARFRGQPAAGPFAKLVSDPDRLMPDPGYGDRLGFLHLVHDDIRKVLRLVATQDSPLVVFVDDLDRCSPGTVAQVIEAINLFLAGEFPDCIFVLAMEPALVAAHVEVTYKELVTALREGHAPTGEWTTLGWRFLEKIVQLPLSLPKTQPAGEVTAYVRSLLDLDLRRPESPPDDARTPASTVDSELVRRITDEVVARGPTVTTLPDLARRVQAELRPDTADEQLLPETVRAVERVFGDLYSDADAADAMEAALPALASANPREIKRYINLFRFYTFIVQRQRLQGVPAPSGDSIAKLAALAIRWPHLLPALSRDGTVICALEQAARDDETWEAAAKSVGLLPRHGTDDLRTFLHSGPEIGGIAARLL